VFLSFAGRPQYSAIDRCPSSERAGLSTEIRPVF
jgi:hypothetical protein